MARKHKPTKTKYHNIYEVETVDGGKEYLATWTQKGRQYFQKNLTKLYGCNTAKKAETTLSEIKALINQGKSPFNKESSDKNQKFSELVLKEIDSRNASDNYKYIQRHVYLKHLDKSIGNLKLHEVTISTIEKTFRKIRQNYSFETIANLKKSIRPVLDYAVDEGLISSNPLNSLKIKKLTKATHKHGKAPLKHRLTGKDNNKYLNVAKTLYQAALTYQPARSKQYEDGQEFQICFLIAIMTARRRSEILKISYEDITEYGTVKTKAETTKTNVWEEYPLPKEVLDRLNPEGKGPIVSSVTPKRYSYHFKQLIGKLDLPVHTDMKITGHDTRNLFLTIMSKETKNPFLCDVAISHDQSNYKMLLTYYEPDISDFIELFEWYWDLLRGKRELQPTHIQNIANI
jgi:integrase